MVIKPVITVVTLTVLFILLSIALVSTEGNDERVFGRALLPIAFPTQPTQHCVTTLFGKVLVRRCE